MGTINDYFLKHGTAGLRELAKKAGTKLSYLQQLNYIPSKRPSMALAERLVVASDGELTFEGLANPSKRLMRDARQDADSHVAG